jgi:hypothetical protein
LILSATILPSPDASSAFIVTAFAGVATAIPRGVLELTLTFDPRTAGLWPLAPPYGTSVERVRHRFVQPLGLVWPLPPGGGGP